MTRDQKRAIHAYRSVNHVSDHESYKIAVNDFGPNIVRSGLAATMSLAERKQEGHALVLDHLAGIDIPGFPGQGRDIPAAVRAMDIDSYMLATRETLKMVQWLKRAVQAAHWKD